MIIAKAEKNLRKNLMNQYIFKFDAQDKYFLTRQIERLFPELPNPLVGKSVDKCIKMIKHPITKDDFVRLFLDQLFLIVENDLE